MAIKRIVMALLLCLLVRAVDAQTELYNRYSSRSDIRVACVNNMRLDSVSQIEVTILEATDDKSWDWILQEFDIVGQPLGQMSVMFTMRDRREPSKTAPIEHESLDQENSCYVGVDFKNMTLYVFAAISGTPPDSLLKYLIAKMINQN